MNVNVVQAPLTAGRRSERGNTLGRSTNRVRDRCNRNGSGAARRVAVGVVTITFGESTFAVRQCCDAAQVILRKVVKCGAFFFRILLSMPGPLRYSVMMFVLVLS